MLDLVSRPDVCAALHGPLVQGYALDALEAVGGTPLDPEHAAAFLGAALGAPATDRRGVGAGTHLDVANSLVAGSGLVSDGELVQLSAFAAQAPTTRIRRPSRRR